MNSRQWLLLTLGYAMLVVLLLSLVIGCGGAEKPTAASVPPTQKPPEPATPTAEPPESAGHSEREVGDQHQADLDQAIADYDQAIALDPQDADAYYNKACAYALISEVDQACAWLEQAIGLDEKYRQMAAEDSDFDGIREEACFRALVDWDDPGEGTSPRRGSHFSLGYLE